MKWGEMMKTMLQSQMLQSIFAPFVCFVRLKFHINSYLIICNAIGTDTEAEEAQQDHFIETRTDGDYEPYPNKVVCLCDWL